MPSPPSTRARRRKNKRFAEEDAQAWDARAEKKSSAAAADSGGKKKKKPKVVVF